MNLNKAVNVLVKKFALTGDAFDSLVRWNKDTVIAWAKQVVDQRDKYQLSRDQHAFLIGEIKVF